MTLLDPDVLIELRRGGDAAAHFLSQLPSPDLPVPGMVALEFLIGSRNSSELDRARKPLRAVQVVWHNEDDNRLALSLVERYRLSTGLGLADFLIAAQAINRSATLYTFNLKHFRAIPGLDARAPYLRS